MWSTQEYFDWLQGRAHSYLSMTHQAKTLSLLQKRLDEGSRDVSDTTIAVVVTLVMMAALTGDSGSATKHMTGLHKMVLLRGGLDSLKHNTQIQIKACR